MSVNGNGNVAALCEALELCKHELCEMCRRHNPGETCVNGCETIIRAKTALAANQPIYGQHPQFAPVGDAAAMREALVAVKKSIDGIGTSSLDCDPEILMMSLTQVCARLSARIERALAKPPRNCDVGTAEEQAKRLREFCKKHRDGVRRCSRCPVERIFPKDCTLAWAQMPYDEPDTNK